MAVHLHSTLTVEAAAIYESAMWHADDGSEMAAGRGNK
jgi:hypothetical protein